MALAVLLSLMGAGVLVWLFLRAQSDAEPPPQSAWVVDGDVAVLEGPTMGTRFRVVVAGPGALDLPRLESAVVGTLEAVNARMSTYIEDSELNRFNRAPADAPFEASEELTTVMRFAQRVSRESDGAFDMTVGPLVDAWGFGAGEAQKEPDLTAILPRVGWQKVTVPEDTNRLQKARDDVRSDLSAIAKGYGVDAVGEALTAAGAKAWLVEVGGEVRAQGAKIDGSPWRVGIERPSAHAHAPREAGEVVELRGQAMATSGDYRNYVERDGRRLSHTIDPRTGRPIEHTLASVSVVTDTCMAADAYATAINVLGPDRGLAFAQERNLAVYMLVRQGEGFVPRETAAFGRLRPSGAAAPGAEAP